ncbi:glycosyltransferase [Geothrix paludis]|uniref:glycosyltransferase n=1 Tax=Geothrix paludis TaxID=2922722 RepID=UPI001FAD9F55|nr:glycosyltransferase [Geothrix paludis]
MTQSATLPSSQAPRALYLSPLDLRANNGMLQRQLQILKALEQAYSNRLDVLSLSSSPEETQRWLQNTGFKARALGGVYPQIARLNALAWYGGNVIACNKLKLIKHFTFPVTTPLPARLIDRYQTIVCYYPWAFHLLGLHRGGGKVVVDLGDVMAERHERIGTRRWISLRPRDERAILHSRARCIAISEGDQAEFQRLYGVSLPVATFLPVDHDRFAHLQTDDLPATVGYLAARGYQNEVVIQALASETFLNTLKTAGVGLVLAGGICASLAEADRARVEAHGGQVLGRVPALEDFYEKVGWVINPVGPSTGVKIKSVEALLAGRGLVTTEFGVDAGLQALFETQIVLTGWPLELQELADTVVRSVRQRPTGDLPFSQASTSHPARQYVEAVQAAITRHFSC